MSFLSLLVMVRVCCLGGRSLLCLLTKQVPKLQSVKEKETVGSMALPTRATGREGPFLICKREVNADNEGLPVQSASPATASSHLQQQLAALQGHLAGRVKGHFAGSPLVGLHAPLRGCDRDEATVQPSQEVGPLTGFPAVLKAVAATVDNRHCAH